MVIRLYDIWTYNWRFPVRSSKSIRQIILQKWWSHSADDWIVRTNSKELCFAGMQLRKVLPSRSLDRQLRICEDRRTQTFIYGSTFVGQIHVQRKWSSSASWLFASSVEMDSKRKKLCEVIVTTPMAPNARWLLTEDDWTRVLEVTAEKITLRKALLYNRHLPTSKAGMGNGDGRRRVRG